MDKVQILQISLWFLQRAWDVDIHTEIRKKIHPIHTSQHRANRNEIEMLSKMQARVNKHRTPL